MFAAQGGGGAGFGWGGGKAGGGCWLGYAVALEKSVSREVVRVGWCFGHGQHWGHAGIAAGEDFGPFVATAGGDGGGDAHAQGGPMGAVIAGGEIGLIQPQALDEEGEELRLDRPTARKPLQAQR